jgi:hypothetical protein
MNAAMREVVDRASFQAELDTVRMREKAPHPRGRRDRLGAPAAAHGRNQPQNYP